MRQQLPHAAFIMDESTHPRKLTVGNVGAMSAWVSCWQRTPADRAQKDGLTGNVREAAEVFRVRRLVPLEWARGGAGNGRTQSAQASVCRACAANIATQYFERER